MFQIGHFEPGAYSGPLSKFTSGAPESAAVRADPEPTLFFYIFAVFVDHQSL